MKAARILYILFFISTTFNVSGLEIKGKVNLQENWQPIVFLASLSSPEDIFVASPDFIIAQTFIQPDGSFSLSTRDVPNDFMFYRIYMVRGDNTTVEFNTTENRNYQHLLLNRNSSVNLQIDTANKTFSITNIQGSEESKRLMEFDQSFQEKQQGLLGNLTKAKSNYLSRDLEISIKDFVTGSPNALVGLYALYHIDGKETHFLQNSEFYFDFQKRMDKEFPGTRYAQEYDELLKELIGFRDFVCQMPGVQPKWKDQLLVAQFALILVLLLVTTVLLIKLNKQKRSSFTRDEDRKDLIDALTTKQQEILKLLSEGKTNKEIALELFVELSTVKTHINNIYRQLGVASRQEAVAFYRSVNQ